MTSLASNVAALSLPLEAGAANARIPEPLVVGLLAYLGFWIKWGTDAKLATIKGPLVTAGSSVAITDACPLANRLPYNPGTWWVRFMTEATAPALWVWAKGSKRTKLSTVYDIRERQMGFLYAFPEVLAPRALVTRFGLMSAVDALIIRALDRGAHPDYENGVQFCDTIADPNTLELAFDSSEEGFEASRPETGAGAGGRADGGFEQYGFPTLRGTIVARERVSGDSFEDPGDILGDIDVTITHNEYGDVSDGLTILEGVLPGPDGSEDGDEEA